MGTVMQVFKAMLEAEFFVAKGAMCDTILLASIAICKPTRLFDLLNRVDKGCRVNLGHLARNVAMISAKVLIAVIAAERKVFFLVATLEVTVLADGAVLHFLPVRLFLNYTKELPV